MIIRKSNKKLYITKTKRMNEAEEYLFKVLEKLNNTNKKGHKENE